MPAPDVFQYRQQTPPPMLWLVDHVWDNQGDYLSWPQHMEGQPFQQGVVRVPWHPNPTLEQAARLEAAGVAFDRRPNGPAIVAFLLSGGVRPARANGRGWPIHHLYDGNFSGPNQETTVRAVADGDYFTHAGGLIAIHPVAHEIAHEVAYFAWLLRRTAYERFGFNPDGVF